MRWIATLAICAFAICALAQESEQQAWQQEPLPADLYIKPYLQNVTQTSIVVMWETKTAVVGHVDYGDSEALGNTVSETAPAKIHELVISGLEAGKRYYYQARYGDVKLDMAFFKTAPPDGTRQCRIIMYGDARSNPHIHRKNVEQMVGLDADIIVHTGDIVARGTEYPQWQGQHFGPIQIISDKVPMFTCLGNHERNSSLHFEYMSLPGNEVYFSFDYANVHIICLDSNDTFTPYESDSPQYRWLVADLEANRDKEWIFVAFHHPLFRCHPTRGVDDHRFVWHPLFEKYGVDIVFSGHDHYYFRSHPIGKLGLQPERGVRYVTTAGGGAPLYPVEDRVYGAFKQSVHHFTVLDIDGDKLTSRALDIDGNLVETFTLTTTQKASDEEYVAYEVFEMERSIFQEMAKVAPTVVDEAGSVEINERIAVDSNFDIRIEGKMVWQDSENWQFPAKEIPFIINPGAKLEIPIQAKANFPNIYPTPQLTIHFDKLVARKRGFRNRQISFYPIKVKPLLPVTIRKTNEKIAIDGEANELAWAHAAAIDDFVCERGNAPAQQRVLAWLLYDDENLYVAAEIQGDSEYTTRGREEHDHYRLERNEHFAVTLDNGTDTYVFAVNARGTQADANQRDKLAWNHDWQSKTTATKNGWAIEMAIPYQKLTIENSNWRIGLRRLDRDNGEMAALAPTFTIGEMGNQLPEYEHEIMDRSSLCPIVLE